MKLDKPSSRERIDHIIKAIQSIQTYSQSHTLESFLQDDKTIDACLYKYTLNPRECVENKPSKHC